MFILAALLMLQPQTPVIKSTSRLVQVNVIVHKGGKPVRGLTQADFIVLDNGRPQQIRNFSIQERNPVIASASATAARPEPLPPGVAANRVIGGSAANTVAFSGSLTAVFIDSNGMGWSDQIQAKNGLIKLLRAIQPEDRVAVYVLAGGLRVLHGFSSDYSSLEKVVAQLQITNYSGARPPQEAYGRMTSDEQELNAVLAEINRRGLGNGTRASSQIAYLEAICRQMSGFPGRKSLVWFGSGIEMYTADPFGPSAYTAVSEGLKQINNTGIAVYPVDSRGLMGPMTFNPALSAASETSIRSGALHTLPSYNPKINDSQLSMRIVAERTGGRAFMNRNDLPAALRRALDDGDVSYNLSYIPDHNEWDGKFRKIQVQVNRSGVDVRNRGGYFANADEDTPEQRADSLERAAESPLLGTELGLRTLSGPALPAGVPRGEIRIIVDPRDISFQPGEKGKTDALLDLMMVFRDNQGQIIGRDSRAMVISLDPARRAVAETQGIAFNGGLAIPEKTYRVRVVVRDTSSGALGSVDVTLER